MHTYKEVPKNAVIMFSRSYLDILNTISLQIAPNIVNVQTKIMNSFFKEGNIHEKGDIEQLYILACNALTDTVETIVEENDLEEYEETVNYLLEYTVPHFVLNKKTLTLLLDLFPSELATANLGCRYVNEHIIQNLH